MHFTGDVFTRVGTLRRDKNILEGSGTSIGEGRDGEVQIQAHKRK